MIIAFVFFVLSVALFVLMALKIVGGILHIAAATILLLLAIVLALVAWNKARH
jgi:hypothetical protein